jgi:hypothetical protein
MDTQTHVTATLLQCGDATDGLYDSGKHLYFPGIIVGAASCRE